MASLWCRCRCKRSLFPGNNRFTCHAPCCSRCLSPVIFERCPDGVSHCYPVTSLNVRAQSASAILPARCFVSRAPPIQLRPSLVHLRGAAIGTVIRRIATVVSTRVVSMVIAEVPSIIRSNGKIVVIVDRIAPSEVVIVVCCVIDGPIVKVEIGVTVPRSPPVGGCVALNHTNFGLSIVG